MGSKQTKFEGTYKPDTPVMQLKAATLPRQNAASQESSAKDEQDPRSPSGFRTPIQICHVAPRQRTDKVAAPTPQATQNTENTFGALRKRLLKSFALNDPRSPIANRTPLIFDEAVDRTLNLNDTFADLFVESRAPASESNGETVEMTASNVKVQLTTEVRIKETTKTTLSVETHNNSSLEMASLPEAFDAEATMPCSALLQQRTPITPAPLSPQQKFDPRSPTVGVDRTPIIFCDEDEAHEAQMLENILETLTLNLNNDSSIASFASAKSEQFENVATSETTALTHEKSSNKPNNKHLERVRLGNKQRVVPPRKPVRRPRQQQQHVYEDIENCPQTNATSTPMATPTKPKSINSAKRTPLGCVKNRTHLRSRSVEHSNKSLGKPALPLQSFDDQLNPSACGFIPSLHMLQNVEDSLDAAIH